MRAERTRILFGRDEHMCARDEARSRGASGTQCSSTWGVATGLPARHKDGATAGGDWAGCDPSFAGQFTV